MPEGDTIRALAQRITDRCAGQQVERCVTRDPRLSGVDLTGRTIIEAASVGKHLLIRFDDDTTVYSHLVMDGRWDVGRTSPAPEWKRRLELWLTGGRLTAVDIPRIGLIPSDREYEIVGHLGPDLCAPDAPIPFEVAERLTIDPTRPLAAAMLDQRLVAGFGNVFAIEIPFLLGVSPHQPIGSIHRLDNLVAIGIALIRWSSDGNHRNTTGKRLTQSDYWIYDKADQRCPICGARLSNLEADLSTWGRATVWCPNCQASAHGQVTADTGRAIRLLALHPARRAPMFPSRPADGPEHRPAGRP